ncbi:unnamed protein product [Rotaria sordida]|nr:unnamed protein product [Rotaria sordida]
MLLFNQQGQMNPSDKVVLTRTSLTFLGIFTHVFISNIFLPITARALIKTKVLVTMIINVLVPLKSSSEDFCAFIGPSVTYQQ